MNKFETPLGIKERKKKFEKAEDGGEEDEGGGGDEKSFPEPPWILHPAVNNCEFQIVQFLKLSAISLHKQI